MSQPQLSTKFVRFSVDIRGAMKIANREAIRSNLEQIDTPHLLLAMAIEKTGLAGAVLRQRHIQPERIREVMPEFVGRGWRFALLPRLRLAPQLESVIASAKSHAVQEKHDSVGTGAIFLTMLRHDPRTIEILRLLAIDAAQLEPLVNKYLHRFMVEAPGQVLQLDPLPETLS